MKKVMICSPYAGDVERNIAYAKECMQDSINSDECPIAPHLIYPQVLDDNDPVERRCGLELAKEWIETVDIIAFYVDNGFSAGMIGELEHCLTCAGGIDEQPRIEIRRIK